MIKLKEFYIECMLRTSWHVPYVNDSSKMSQKIPEILIGQYYGNYFGLELQFVIWLMLLISKYSDKASASHISK